MTLTDIRKRMRFPKKYSAAAAPREVLALIDRLVPSLIEGDHPALAALREQFRRLRVREVEMMGVGFYAEFDVPLDAPLAEPSNFAGGNATIALEGASHGAGCVLFVRDGRRRRSKVTRSMTPGQRMRGF
jgi:hypothetical protein